MNFYEKMFEDWFWLESQKTDTMSECLSELKYL